MHNLKNMLERYLKKSKPSDGYKIAIVGMGGLGSASAEMLCRTGAETLVLIDDDCVELSNLQRQSLYYENDVGMSKVSAARNRLVQINPKLNVICYNMRLTQQNTGLLDSDVVLDCSDNLKTRFIMNKYCIDHNIPLVYCSIAADHGFVKVITKDNGCLECVYSSSKKPESSDTVGILNTTVQMGSALQVMQALKILAKDEYDDELLSFDVWRAEIKKIAVRKKASCSVCGKK